MTEVKFYDKADDKLLRFAVIIAKTNGKWVFCKHKERSTYENPGGKREKGESILDAAKRELYEETGATKYDIRPICVYSATVSDDLKSEETFGMIYFADIFEFEKELHSEIQKIIVTEKLIDNWTYPLIQPKLIEEAKNRGYV